MTKDALYNIVAKRCEGKAIISLELYAKTDSLARKDFLGDKL